LSWFDNNINLLFLNFFFLAVAVLMALIWAYRLKMVLNRSNGLRRLAQKFQRLFQSTTEGVFRIDAAGRLLIINRAGAGILGYDSDAEMMERAVNVQAFIPDAVQLSGLQARLIETGQLNHRIIPVKRQDDEITYIEVVVHVQDEQGAEIYEGIFRDVSARIALERELETHKLHLEELVTQRTEALEGANALLRRRESQLKNLSRKQTHLQEDERKRIAHILHDDAGQLLSAVKIDLDMLEHQMNSREESMGLARVMDAQSIMEQLMNSVHELALDLRPSILDDMGLGPTLAWFVKRFQERTGIEVHLSRPGGDRRLEAEMETDLYRISQEALNNVAKHAAASRVNITLNLENDISLVISDNGKGFDAATVFDVEKNRERMGLIGIREKVTATGGCFELDTKPGLGLTLNISYTAGASS